ncbi:MAG: copper amine oxidase [Firmicutes bacterium]|nr:copper amine oxidase [Bacillota bacterium]
MNRGREITSIILLFMICIFFVPGDPVAAEEMMAGDVSGDGVVNVFDAILVLRHVVGLGTLSDEEEARADLNGDGKVDVSDAIAILRHVVGLDGPPSREIAMGDTEAKLLRNLGEPARKDPSEYGFEWYIYNRNYDQYIQVGVDGGKVVGIYTNSDCWQMGGSIGLGSTREELVARYGVPLEGILKGNINYLFNENQKKQMSVYLFDDGDGYYAYFFLDIIDSAGDKVTAVQLIDRDVEESMEEDNIPFSTALREGYERQSMDLANAIRARYGKPPFQWCEKARMSARKHSQDMAYNDYFAHVNLQGESPGQRMTREEIDWSRCAENIAAGPKSAIMAHEAWMNSLGHRGNILGTDLDYMGAGVAFGGSFRIYYTQNFYKPW